MKYNNKKLGIVLTDMQKSINKGVAYLDKNVGRKKWLRKINPNMLDMSRDSKCICGFVFGDYNDFLDKGVKNVKSINNSQAENYGFFLKDIWFGYNSDVSEDVAWDLLGHLWIDKINSLK